MIMSGDADLFGINRSDDKFISLSIYCDEIKRHSNYNGEQWFYLGMLLIPDAKKNAAFKKLSGARTVANYPFELHFSKLTNLSTSKVYNEKTLLSKLWLDILINDYTDQCFYFNILGINVDKITWQLFGHHNYEHFENAYTRFFRTLIKSSLNNFFKDNKITITAIFHDVEQSLKKHEYFNWNAIYKLRNEMQNVSFLTDSVQFIDSDHEKEEIYSDESHFIQLIDLILGSFKQAFDKTTKREGSTEIAKIFAKHLKVMMDNPFNPQYFRKYSFSFFPSQQLKSGELTDDWSRISSKFYNKRELLVLPNQQLELF